MHELAVTQSILEIATRHAQQAGARKITNLYLVIGQLASIVDDSVQFYWDELSEGTIAEGATLHFQRIPTELQCQNCQHTYTLTGDELTCPQCGSAHVKVKKGEEFYL